MLHGHYAASLLLRAPPPPSRLPPFSWVRQLYGFLASATFMTGRGGLLQLLNMSLSPCYPYHPAGVSCRFGQPAPCHAAFAPKQRARPPDLSSVSRPPTVLLSLWPGDLLPILKDCFRRSASSALLSSADATPAKGLLTFTLVGLPTEPVYLSWTHWFARIKGALEMNTIHRGDVTLTCPVACEITIRQPHLPTH